MLDTIKLTEYQNWGGDLSEEDALFIKGELTPKISIQRDFTGNQYTINPAQYVGVLSLPSGRRIESIPKIPIGNLFYMLATIQDISSIFRDQITEFQSVEDIFEFVVKYFNELVERKIDTGLYRAYTEREDNLAAVRGRIKFNEDVRENYILRHRTYCSYSDLTWDIPENQIIRQVAHLLSGWGFNTDTRNRLSVIDRTLYDVTPTVFPSSKLDGVYYHRFNDEYRQIHQLCRLFLDGASVNEDAGTVNFLTFLIDMNKLFEDFIARIMWKGAGDQYVVSPHMPMYLGNYDKVKMFPDIIVYRDSHMAFAADCKYKRIDQQEVINSDIYQIFAYCTALKIDNGFLLYSKDKDNIRETIQIKNSSILIHLHSVDLSKKGNAFTVECDSLFDDMIDRIGTV